MFQQHNNLKPDGSPNLVWLGFVLVAIMGFAQPVIAQGTDKPFSFKKLSQKLSPGKWLNKNEAQPEIAESGQMLRSEQRIGPDVGQPTTNSHTNLNSASVRVGHPLVGRTARPLQSRPAHEFPQPAPTRAVPPVVQQASYQDTGSKFYGSPGPRTEPVPGPDGFQAFPPNIHIHPPVSIPGPTEGSVTKFTPTPPPVYERGQVRPLPLEQQSGQHAPASVIELQPPAPIKRKSSPSTPSRVEPLEQLPPALSVPPKNGFVPEPTLKNGPPSGSIRFTDSPNPGDTSTTPTQFASSPSSGNDRTDGKQGRGYLQQGTGYRGRYLHSSPPTATERALELTAENQRLRDALQRAKTELANRSQEIQAAREAFTNKEAELIKSLNERNQLKSELAQLNRLLKNAEQEKIAIQRRADETLKSIEANLDGLLMNSISKSE